MWAAADFLLVDHLLFRVFEQEVWQVAVGPLLGLVVLFFDWCATFCVFFLGGGVGFCQFFCYA